ncbi:MAG: hypothetical protein CME01_00045 [Geminicoccus sp.]|nr:hypothetical protein [Geminicoccus sp.]
MGGKFLRFDEVAGSSVDTASAYKRDPFRGPLGRKGGDGDALVIKGMNLGTAHIKVVVELLEARIHLHRRWRWTELVTQSTLTEGQQKEGGESRKSGFFEAR